MGHFGKEAGAALVFLIGYILIFAWMTYAYAHKLIEFRSRYSLLYFHVIVRIASQACGIAFGILVFDNIDVFLAYLILGAEGYFTLVLCAYRFLISWHQHHLPTRESWLEPRDKDWCAGPDDKAARWRRRRKIILMVVLGPLAVCLYWRSPMVIAHTFLILANMAIIFGGSYLAGAPDPAVDPVEFDRRNDVSKVARTGGQVVFLVCNALLLVAIVATIMGERSRGKKKMHGMLMLLTIAWVPLIVRGVFGLLQACTWSLSYYNRSNYGKDGFTARFLAIEYVFGVFTEWLACVLLNLTYFTSRQDPSTGACGPTTTNKSILDPEFDSSSAALTMERVGGADVRAQREGLLATDENWRGGSIDGRL